MAARSPVPDIHHPCALFADTIADIFHSGIEIDQHVIHYLDATFSGHDLETIRAVLQNPSDCEHDPLIELLYFPNESIQIRLEAFLEKARFTEKDQHAIGSLLTSRAAKTRFCFSGQTDSWKFPTPDAGALAFLSRLKITRHLDKRLIACMNQHLPLATRDRFKVKIRNAGFEMSLRNVECLESFLVSSDLSDRNFDHRFRFLLDFVEEWKSPDRLLDALTEKKRLYIRQLYRAARMESLQQKRNIETLMMLGFRSPYVNRQDILSRIAAIDDIALAIFGQSVYVEGFSMV
jgi:hypothetical protein